MAVLLRGWSHGTKCRQYSKTTINHQGSFFNNTYAESVIHSIRKQDIITLIYSGIRPLISATSNKWFFVGKKEGYQYAENRFDKDRK